MKIQAAEIEIHETETETTTTHIVFPLQKTFIHVFFLPSAKFNKGRPYRRYKVSLYTPRYLKFDIHTLRNLRSQRIGPTTSPLRNPLSIPGLCGDRQADNLPRFKLSVLTVEIGPHGSTLWKHRANKLTWRIIPVGNWFTNPGLYVPCPGLNSLSHLYNSYNS